MMGRIIKRTGLAAAVSLIAALASASAQQERSMIALAQDGGNPFSALVGEKRERRADRPGQRKVERYVLASDNRAFLIETRTRTARAKFLCGSDDARLDCTLDPEVPAPEIYLLTMTRGPRGDLIFKNADNKTYLRIASYGGATVFWPGEEHGSAASKSFGDDRIIELVDADSETLQRRTKAATAIISAMTGSPIIFETPAPKDADFQVLADAVMRTAVGLARVADDPTGARILGARISRVLFQSGSAPSAAFERNTLIVTYVPDQDIAGRLTSRAVERFLEDSL